MFGLELLNKGVIWRIGDGKKVKNLATHVDPKELLPAASRETKTMQTQEDLPSPN